MNSPELELVTASLQTLSPGELPFPLFLEVARLVALPVVELVLFRKTYSGDIEILLLRRPSNDPVWPNMFHSPGTIIRSTDTQGSFTDAFVRIIQDELQSSSKIQPVFLETSILHTTRGTVVISVFYTELPSTVKVGTFYPVTKLPLDLVNEQREFIQHAVDAYMKTSLQKT